LGGEKLISHTRQRFLDPLSLDGVVVDDSDAKLSGKWISSTHNNGFVGLQYLHDDNKDKGNKSITFSANIPHQGEYDVQVSYTSGPNRSKRTPVTVMHADGEQKIYINQTKAPNILGSFKSVGKFNFDKRERDVVQITTEGTTKVVIVDAIRLVPVIKESIADLSRLPAVDFEDKTKVKIQIKNAEKQVAEWKKAIEEHKKKTPPKVQKVMSVLEQKEVGDGHIIFEGEYVIWDRLFRGVFWSSLRLKICLLILRSRNHQAVDWNLLAGYHLRKTLLPHEYLSIECGTICLVVESWRAQIISEKWGIVQPTLNFWIISLSFSLIKNGPPKHSFVRLFCRVHIKCPLPLLHMY
jgi:hypothetical protein